jgi:hypothetical protein
MHTVCGSGTGVPWLRERRGRRRSGAGSCRPRSSSVLTPAASDRDPQACARESGARPNRGGADPALPFRSPHRRAPGAGAFKRLPARAAAEHLQQQCAPHLGRTVSGGRGRAPPDRDGANGRLRRPSPATEKGTYRSLLSAG